MLFSRHNSVRRIPLSGGVAVRKLFDSPDDWETELSVFRRLANTPFAPRLISSAPGVLLMEYIDHPTFLEVLEAQEREGFSETPWLSLCGLLEELYAATGLVPGDPNLRNYLWNRESGDSAAVDFEHYRKGDFRSAMTELAAFLLEYDPPHSAVKQSAAELIMNRWRLSGDAVLRACSKLLDRRKNRPKTAVRPDCSLIVLAGGRSRRMGADKSSLPLCGIPLLQHQTDKAALLGMDDVLVSGTHIVPGSARSVPDLLPDRGPLGGLHACMMEARHDSCLVLSVDTPLIPPCFLRSLITAHAGTQTGVTLSVHDGIREPLIGVYSRKLLPVVESLIARSGAPVRELTARVPVHEHPSELPGYAWINCNTPEDYRRIVSLSESL